MDRYPRLRPKTPDVSEYSDNLEQMANFILNQDFVRTGAAQVDDIEDTDRTKVYGERAIRMNEQNAVLNQEIAAALASGQLSYEEEVELLREANQVKATPDSIDLNKEIEDQEIVAQDKDWMYESLVEETEYYDRSKEFLKEQYNELAPEWSVGSVAGAIEGMIPFHTGASWRGVEKEIFGDAPITNFFTPGESQDRIRSWILAADGMGRIERSKRLLEALEDVGIFDNNTFMKYQMFYEATHGALNESDLANFDWDRHLNNVIGVTDALILAPLAKSALNIGKLPPGNPLGALQKSNPEKAAEVMATIINDDSGQLAKKFGVTRDDIFFMMGIKPGLDSPTRHGTQYDITLLDNALKMRNLAGEHRGSAHLFSDEEKADFILNLGKDIAIPNIQIYEASSNVTGITKELLKGKGTPKEIAEKIKLEETGAGAFFQVVYGGAKDTPWETYRQAELAAKNLPWGTGNYKILRANARTGQLDEAGPRSRKGEFYIQVTDFRPYKAEFFPEGRLKFSTHHPVSRAGLNKSAYLSPPSSRFAPEIIELLLDTFGREKALASNLLGLIEKPFIRKFGGWEKGGSLASNLKKQLGGINEKGRDVIDKLVEGAKEGRVYTPDELIGAGFNEDQVLAYRALRQFYDYSYELSNMKLRDTLSAQKYQWYKTDDYTAAVKVAQTLADANKIKGTDNVISVYDPKTKTILELDSTELANHYGQGQRIGKISHKEKDFSAPDKIRQAEYILISDLDKQVQGLPRYVLNYTNGYIGRHYKDRHYLVKNYTAKQNGKSVQVTEAVGVAPNIKVANELKASMNAKADPGVSYDWRHARELIDISPDAEFDYMYNTGKTIFSKRGDPLVDLDTGLEALTSDPLTAIQRTAKILARHHGKENPIKVLKSRWMSSFGTRLGIDDFPESMNAIDAILTHPQIGNLEAKKAHMLATYIKQVEGSIVDPILRKYKGKAIEIGDWLANHKMRGLGEWVQDRALKDPFAFPRTFTFYSLIVANPIRQLILQSQQTSMLALYNPSYFWNPNGLGKDHIMMAAAVLRNEAKKAGHTAGFNKDMQKIADQFGKSPDELMAMVKAYDDSGLKATIDYHTFLDRAEEDIISALSVHPISQALHSAKRISMLPLDLMRRVGFDFGEETTRMATWLIERDKFIKANPGVDWSSRKSLQNINAKASALTFSMNLADQYAYQKGILSLMTQFASVQMKALNLMLPKAWGGSQLLTTNEKTRIALANLLLYGSAGFGVQEIWKKIRDEAGIEVPEELDRLIVGGIGERFGHAVLSAAAGEDVRTDISSATAPASGIFNMGGTIFEGLAGVSGKTLPELMMGASFTSMGRVGKAINAIGSVLHNPQLETEEGIKIVLQESASIMSGFSNFAKAKAMMKTGHFVSSSKNPILQDQHATWVDAMMKAAGFQSHQEAEFYRQLMKAKDSKEAINKDAKALVDEILLIEGWQSKWSTEADQMEFLNALDKYVQRISIMTNAWDDEQRTVLVIEQANKILKARGMSSVPNFLYNTYMKYGLDDQALAAMKGFNSAGALSDEDYAALESLYINAYAPFEEGEE